MAHTQDSTRLSILLFTYYWPPGGGAGVQRWVKFVKYLSQQGHEIHVVTPKEPSVPFMDHSLEKEVPKNVMVYKTKAIEPFGLFNLLRGRKGKGMSAGTSDLMGGGGLKRLALYIRSNYFIPDARKGWNPYARKKGEEIIKDKKIDVLITTGPPHSTHLIGLELKRKFGLPWLADFRDPWTTIYYLKLFPLTNSSWKKHRELEKKVLSEADQVVTVSENMKRDLQNGNSGIRVIYNGFDEGDFPESDFSGKEDSNRLIMSYIGNFKPNQNFHGLVQILKKAMDRVPQLKLKFVGPIDRGARDVFQSGLGERVEFIGSVSHTKAVEYMLKTDILLFIIPRGQNEKGIITGKIYEYLASKKPILAIGPEDGDASNILDQVGVSFPMVDYSNHEKILDLIEDTSKSPEPLHYPGLAKFSRKNLSTELSSVLKTMVNG